MRERRSECRMKGRTEKDVYIYCIMLYYVLWLPTLFHLYIYGHVYVVNACTVRVVMYM